MSRGTDINPANRFEELSVEWDFSELPVDEERPVIRTKFYEDASVSAVTWNDSPDIPFDAGVNPYRGCEHGCAYCYARPTHEYLGFSAGLDFETKIMVKKRLPELLRKELASPKWKPQCVMMSGVTDCYQPAEKHFKLTRACLEVFLEFRNPVGIITKNALVSRDLDILSELAKFSCVEVFISITSLDADLARELEPRAASPRLRLETVRRLRDAGVPVGVMLAPIIPGLTDAEIPALLKAAAEAGARSAAFTMLRLPYGVKDIFQHWLETKVPTKAAKILSLIRGAREGKLNKSEFGERMRGSGIYAGQIKDLFRVSRQKAGITGFETELSTAFFRNGRPKQLDLL